MTLFVEEVLEDVLVAAPERLAEILEARRKAARDVDAEVPAPALTAYACSHDAEKPRRAGYPEHLAKPVHAAVLVATLGRRLAPRSAPPLG